MHAPAAGNSSSIEDLLGEIERLLEVETEALKQLDRDRIEAAAEGKLAAFQSLEAALQKTPLIAAHRAQLERIKRAALKNQVLLVHARDCTRSVIALATGARPSLRPDAPEASGVRLDLRG
jgi:hypothetical protein